MVAERSIAELRPLAGESIEGSRSWSHPPREHDARVGGPISIQFDTRGCGNVNGILDGFERAKRNRPKTQRQIPIEKNRRNELHLREPQTDQCIENVEKKSTQVYVKSMDKNQEHTLHMTEPQANRCIEKKEKKGNQVCVKSMLMNLQCLSEEDGSCGQGEKKDEEKDVLGEKEIPLQKVVSKSDLRELDNREIEESMESVKMEARKNETEDDDETAVKTVIEAEEEIAREGKEKEDVPKLIPVEHHCSLEAEVHSSMDMATIMKLESVRTVCMSLQEQDDGCVKDVPLNSCLSQLCRTESLDRLDEGRQVAMGEVLKMKIYDCCSTVNLSPLDNKLVDAFESYSRKELATENDWEEMSCSCSSSLSSSLTDMVENIDNGGDDLRELSEKELRNICDEKEEDEGGVEKCEMDYCSGFVEEDCCHSVVHQKEEEVGEKDDYTGIDSMQISVMQTMLNQYVKEDEESHLLIDQLMSQLKHLSTLMMEMEEHYLFDSCVHVDGNVGSRNVYQDLSTQPVWLACTVYRADEHEKWLPGIFGDPYVYTGTYFLGNKEKDEVKKLKQCGGCGRSCSGIYPRGGPSGFDGSSEQGGSSGSDSGRRGDRDDSGSDSRRDTNGNEDHGKKNEGNEDNQTPTHMETETEVPPPDYKKFKKKHGVMSQEEMANFLGQLAFLMETQNIPLLPMKESEVLHCVILCLHNPEMDDEMLQCHICTSIVSLLKHFAACLSHYNTCNMCMQSFILICTHVKNCVWEFRLDPDKLKCEVEFCRRIRQFISNDMAEFTARFKSLWSRVKKHLARIIHLEHIWTSHDANLMFPSLESSSLTPAGPPPREYTPPVTSAEAGPGNHGGPEREGTALAPNRLPASRPQRTSTSSFIPSLTSIPENAQLTASEIMRRRALQRLDEEVFEPSSPESLTKVKELAQSELAGPDFRVSGPIDDSYLPSVFDDSSLKREYKQNETPFTQEAVKNEPESFGSESGSTGSGSGVFASREKIYGHVGFTSLPIKDKHPLWDHQPTSLVDKPVGTPGIGEVVYGTRSQLHKVARYWDEQKQVFSKEGSLPKHKREEGVILERYKKYIKISVTRYQKNFQWTKAIRLGNGMFGKCHLATDYTTEHHFCLKKIHIRHYERMEIEIWSDLDHPNIVKIYGAIRLGEKIFILSEFIDGGSLTETINAQKSLGRRLSHWTALKYLHQILLVLEYLKRQQVLHEDLKSDNILLVRGSLEIKIADFGLARRIPGDTVVPGSHPFGTQTQWSPEKAESKGHGFPSEVWAAICVLVHILSGYPPWVRRFGDTKFLHFVIVEKSPPLDDVPHNISDPVRFLIQKGFTSCPKTRPTVEDLLQDPAFRILEEGGMTSIFFSNIGPSLGHPNTNNQLDEADEKIKELEEIKASLQPRSDLQARPEQSVDQRDSFVPQNPPSISHITSYVESIPVSRQPASNRPSGYASGLTKERTGSFFPVDVSEWHPSTSFHVTPSAVYPVWPQTGSDNQSGPRRSLFPVLENISPSDSTRTTQTQEDKTPQSEANIRNIYNPVDAYDAYENDVSPSAIYPLVPNLPDVRVYHPELYVGTNRSNSNLGTEFSEPTDFFLPKFDELLNKTEILDYFEPEGEMSEHVSYSEDDVEQHRKLIADSLHLAAGDLEEHQSIPHEPSNSASESSEEVENARVSSRFETSDQFDSNDLFGSGINDNRSQLGDIQDRLPNLSLAFTSFSPHGSQSPANTGSTLTPPRSSSPGQAVSPSSALATSTPRPASFRRNVFRQGASNSPTHIQSDSRRGASPENPASSGQLQSKNPTAPQSSGYHVLPTMPYLEGDHMNERNVPKFEFGTDKGYRPATRPTYPPSYDPKNDAQYIEPMSLQPRPTFEQKRGLPNQIGNYFETNEALSLPASQFKLKASKDAQNELLKKQRSWEIRPPVGIHNVEDLMGQIPLSTLSLEEPSNGAEASGSSQTKKQVPLKLDVKIATDRTSQPVDIPQTAPVVGTQPSVNIPQSSVPNEVVRREGLPGNKGQLNVRPYSLRRKSDELKPRQRTVTDSSSSPMTPDVQPRTLSSSTPKSVFDQQEEAFMVLGRTAADALSQHSGDVSTNYHLSWLEKSGESLGHGEDERMEGELPSDPHATFYISDEESLHQQLLTNYIDPAPEEDIGTVIEFRSRINGHTERMRFPRRGRSWQDVLENDFSEIRSQFGQSRFCLRHEDGSIVDLHETIGNRSRTILVDEAMDNDPWFVLEDMVMQGTMS